MALIPAIKTNEAFISEVDSLKNEERPSIWWLGQSGYLIQWNHQRLLIDPYLSDSLTKKYAASDHPHVRMSERVVDPELLKDISIVTSSHNHSDHLDGETLIPLLKNNPDIKFIIPEANRDFVAARVKCEREFPSGLNDGRQMEYKGFTFHGIPAKHNELERDTHGNCKYMGYVIAFGRWKIYHSGDTLWFDDMVELLRPFQVDVAFLPINGDDPSRGVAGNLNATEAIRLGKMINAKCVVPCHYDMFTFNTADVKEFEAEARAAGQPFRVLRGGERMELK